MYSHAPPGYDCPFCVIASGGRQPEPWTGPDDIVLANDHVTAFISAAWFGRNHGHVMVIPNRHIENIYDLDFETGAHVQDAARRIAIGLMASYGCEGTSTRQHNGPAGYQEVWHYHLHVFPRWTGDDLYGQSRRIYTSDERRPYVEKLRAVL